MLVEQRRVQVLDHADGLLAFEAGHAAGQHTLVLAARASTVTWLCIRLDGDGRIR